MRWIARVAGLLILFVLAIRPSAGQTVAIPGLYTTGVKNNGTLLSSGATDSHYKITATTATTVYSGTTYLGSSKVVNRNALNTADSYVNNQWIANTGTAQWITAPGAKSTGYSEGGYWPVPSYDYTLTFSMPTNANLATVSITSTAAADDYYEILVNGVVVANTQTASSNWGKPNTYTLTGANANFTQGTNTITYRVYNFPNYSGLIVTNLSGTVAVPETSTLIAISIILVGLAALWYYQRRKSNAATAP